MLGLFMALSMLTRVALWMKTGAAAEWSTAHALQVFGIGMLYDALAGASLLAPLMVFLALCPPRLYARRGVRAWLAIGYAAWVLAMLFIAVSEWIFWDEFGSRFNFIAVDYLIYTHEVVGNIMASYPVVPMLAALMLLSAWVVWRWRGPLLAPRGAESGLARWAPLLLIGVLTAGAHQLVNARLKDQSENRYVNALSGNGVYEFFSALRQNELDYEHHYPSMASDEALRRLRRQLPTPHARLASHDVRDLTRMVDYGQPEQRLNVILISVESLSADYMARFGNREHLTPRLDALAKQGLLFSNLYATGTRTVRGLEALSISVPPTPGQSIVKRPHNEGLFTLATVFQSKGYDTRFLYGGWGYFDNMNAYFSGNGYRVLDRQAIDSRQIHHENIWGVADEDLFTLALQQADASHAQGRPSFMHLMTTSNHRPYTYPEGRIDIPSHASRQGGVKYTDWAIGDFIDRASHKPWFKDTVFVIVADHCASSAGKTDLPVDRYHIPAIVYAPAHIAPQEVPRLASQIDVAPTLLGLLKFKYLSRFLGYDLMDLEAGRERAFVSTYQDLGYLRGDKLVRLQPRGVSETWSVVGGRTGAKARQDDREMVADAIAWYEGAAWAYHHEGLSASGLPVQSYASVAGRR
ncbi:MAG: sulfatase-like hydrolase/transferase [Aquabacterium sp.]